MALLAAGADPLLSGAHQSVDSGDGIEECGGAGEWKPERPPLRRPRIVPGYFDLVHQAVGVMIDGGGLLVATDNADDACVRLLLQRLWQENRHACAVRTTPTFSTCLH